MTENQAKKLTEANVALRLELKEYKGARVVRLIVGHRKWLEAIGRANYTLMFPTRGMLTAGHFKQMWRKDMRKYGLDLFTIFMMLRIAGLIFRWWMRRRNQEWQA